MKLKEVLDLVNELSEDQVFFARRPWSQESEAEIGLLDADFRVPVNVTGRGFEYFLDVSVALEVLEVLKGRECTAEQRRELLIFYAENDAYPDWVYRI